MGIIYRDIVNNWTNCWSGAIITGVLFIICNQLYKQLFSKRNIAFSTNAIHSIQNWQSGILFFADGVFLYYLLYVTLLSRRIGIRREIALMPFGGPEIMSGDYHYVIENVLLFIPFGILLALTLRAYGRKCDKKSIFQAAFLTSMSIELLQYLFSCGKSETDDIITNVLGAMIGYALIRPKRRE